MTPEKASCFFSVASYNVHQCVGVDGHRDPERIAQVIRDLGVNIIGLQEVDSRPDGRAESDQVTYLTDATGFTAIAGPTLQRENGHYGNVLLTTYPILDVRRLDLSVVHREPRGAIDVDLEIRGKPVRIIVTHFGLCAAERRFQAKRLLATFSTQQTHPLVVLGDINEWLPMGRSLRWLHAYLGRSPAPRTFPTSFPLFALDRIWVRPPEALIDVGVCHTPLTRLASDHLPLKARIAAA